MIKTFKEHKREKTGGSGILTFDEHLKNKGLTREDIKDFSVNELKDKYYNEVHKLGTINSEIMTTKNKLASNELLKQGIDTSKSGYYLPEIKQDANVFKRTNKSAAELGKDIMNTYANTDNTSEIKTLKEKRKEQESKTGYALYDYDKKRVEEKEINAYDKSIGRGVNAIVDLLSTVGMPYETYDENGKRTYLDTYTQMKDRKISESYDTKVGKFLGDVVYQGTKIGGSAVLNAIAPGTGTVTYWGNMYRNNLEQALKDGHDESNSVIYATASTVLEYATGKFLGSATKKLTGGKTNEYNKWLKSGISKLVKNDAVQNFFANAGSEATEEFVQEYIDNLNKNIILGEKNKVFSKETFENALYSAGIGAVTGGMFGGKIENDNDINSKNGLKSTDEQLADYKPNVNIDNKIRSNIYTTEAEQETQNRINNDLENINRLKRLRSNALDKLEQKKIDNNIESLNSEINSLKAELNKNKYQYVNSNNEKISNLRYSAVQNNFNNSVETNDFMNLAEKIIEEKNYNITFDPNLTDEQGNLANGKISTSDNGEIEIKLNPKSDKAGEFLLVHEITHAIETSDLSKRIIEFASRNEEFNSALESLKKTYNTSTLSNEVVADISAQLLGNQEFIKSLTIENTKESKHFIKIIYESIKRLLNSLTEEGRYRNFIKDLEKKWRIAYSTQNNNLNGNIYYSTIGLKGAKNLSKNNNTREYKKLINRQKQAEDIHNNSTDTLDNTNIKSKRETGWYKTKYGDWGTLISDKDAKLIKTLEPNKTYRLEEILKHDLLYQAYPMLKKLKVKTADISSSGAHSSIKWLPANNVTNTIFLKNNDILKKDYKNTLLHEINHFIEHKEKYNKMSRGANLKTETKDNYLNNLGEIISNETKINSNLTQDELNDIILPEQAKSKPEYKNIREKLIKSNQKDAIVSVGGKNALQDLEISIQNKIKNNQVVDKKHNKYSRVNEDLGELDDSSFSLEQRISGDELLDAQDLIEEIKMVGAKVDKNGYVTLYHQTTNENADKIRQTGKMFAKEPYVYFSTSENASQSDGRGNTKLEFKIPAEKLILDDIFSDNADVKIKLNSNKELDVSNYIISKNRNSVSNNHKQKQLDIIKNNNPDNDDYHTWIRNVEDIKTLEETINDSDWIDYDEYNPDLSKRDIENAIESGKITIYSSYPIRQGVFVSPSKMEAESYSGNGKVYSKEVNINDVAWIDPTQGQYAKVYDTSSTKYSKNDYEWQEYLDKNYKPTGTRTSMKKMTTPISDPFANSKLMFNEINSKITEKKKQQVEKHYEIEKINDLRNYSNEVDAILTFNNYKEKKMFKDMISKYYGKEVNYSDLKQDLTNNYKERKNILTDYETLDIKNEIRRSKIKVTDNLKKQITDYSNFRKKNFGKLRLSNDGVSIENLYERLNSEYPYIFTEDIINPIDQLNKIADFMNESHTIEEKYYIDDSAIKKVTDYLIEELNNKTPLDELIENIIISKSEIRKSVVDHYRNLAKDYISNSANWKDKSLLSHKTNTMKRNLRDIMPQSEADAIYNEYFVPIKEHNATIEKEMSKYNEKINKLNLNSKEATAVQMLGELKYNPSTKLISEVVYKYIDNNNLSEEKINNAVETFRNVYDDLFVRVNEELRNNGLKEIEYRKGYFPHFTEEHGNTIIGRMAEKLGWKFNTKNLPTDIAGQTEFFTPQKKWTTFQQRRTGDITEYNALKGYDNYLRGAMNLIYHTEDIQKLRALENEIRYQHSDSKIKERVDKVWENNDLDFEEKQLEINVIFNTYANELGNFIQNLRDYTNNISGKKSALDRSAENLIGRKVYNTMENVSRRVSANMVGMNISSAITNFIPLTQAYSQISTSSMLKAAALTLSNQNKTDNFVSKSSFLTNRTNQADRLYKTTLDKINNKSGMLFDWIDSTTSEIIVRGKYLDNIKNGMNEQTAIRNANEFANDIMAGRSLGDQPTLFNARSPITKLFTAFQLEVNNQYGYMFKDLPLDLKDKGTKGLIKAFFKMFVAAWIYNQLAEKVTGRKSAFSPIDIMSETIETVNNDNLSVYDKITNTVENISSELPYIGGILGGGRLPISAGLPSKDSIEYVSNLFDKEKSSDVKKSSLNNLKKELSKPLYYVLPPFGGGQLKKTIEGASMYSKNKTLPGSYTTSGKLRFPVNNDILSKTQSLIFGQYASKNARDYFNGGYAPMSEKQIKEFKESGMTIQDYWKYKNELREIKKTSDLNGKIKYLDSSGNVYWYDKANSILYDANYKKSNRKVESLEKYNKNEKLFSFINSLKISTSAKNYLLNNELGNETTDNYGNIKYVSNNEKIYVDGLLKCKNSKGTIYWYDEMSGKIYNSQGKIVQNVNKNDLKAMTENVTYWYNENNNKLYNSDYQEVNKSLLKTLEKYQKHLDINEYSKYKTYDEYKFATDNSEKYSAIKTFNIDYEKYNEYNNQIKKIQNSNYGFMTKQKVQEYIQTLPLNRNQKIALQKLSGGYSINNYRNEIQKYIEKSDLSQNEKKNLDSLLLN